MQGAAGGIKAAQGGITGFAAQHKHAVLVAQMLGQPFGQRPALGLGLLGQRLGSAIQAVKVIAVGKKEITHGLKRHLAWGQGIVHPARGFIHANAAEPIGQGVQALGVLLMPPVQGQQGLRQLGQLGRQLAQLGLRHGGQIRDCGHRIGQLGDQPRLFVFGKLLNIHPQHTVDFQQHRHRKRPLVLLQLVQITGRNTQGLRQRHLRHAALLAQGAQAHSHKNFGHRRAYQGRNSQNLQISDVQFTMFCKFSVLEAPGFA